MKIKQRDIRKFQARYHRNGSAGEGFFMCSFIFLRGKQAVNLIATFTPCYTDANDTPFECAAQTRVVNPADIHDRYNGSDFYPALCEALAAVERAQPDSLYERSANA